MLTEQQVKECKSKFNLDYHVNYAQKCQELVGFKDKDVLEVGGSLPPEFVFDYLEVKTWTGVETNDYEQSLQETGGLTHQGTVVRSVDKFSDLSFKNKQNQKYNFYLDNIENLPPEYYNQYDLIFSIATFEHIHKLSLALDMMFLALKPGGKLFTVFAPIWSAHNGHHLPEITDKKGNKFNFDNSPIPPWGHLLMTRGEMINYLAEKTDKETAQKIIYYVYQSNHINRFLTQDYIDVIELSLFTINSLQLLFINDINPVIESQLKLRYPHNNYFNNKGIIVILEKSKNLINLNLSQINLIVFPEWSNPEEEVIAELTEVIKQLINIKSLVSITLLINSMDLNPENNQLLLDEIYTYILFDLNFDIFEYLNISFLPELTPVEWKSLLPKIKGRIKISNENQSIINQHNIHNLPQF
jgi:SAM-dependent methyltransferase